MKRIYFIGTHSCGKSSCARWVSQEYNIPLITEIVRQEKAKMELTLDQIRVNPNLIDVLQNNIFQSQLATEGNYEASGEGFVSDRGFDFIVYTSFHARITHSISLLGSFTTYLEKLRSRDSIVFFVRPHKEILTQDADRSPLDLRWEEVCRIDGALQFALELYAIPHISIASLSMRERIRLIERVLDLAGVEKGVDHESD